MGLGNPSLPAQTDSFPSLKVSYVTELPLSWRTGMADPLRNIARSLSVACARPVDPDIPLSAGENLSGADSWEELARSIQLGEAELFPIQGYELLQHQRELKLKPLLLATRNNSWKTQFIMLGCGPRIQMMDQLKESTVLVHRDGCGNLVDLWLDYAIQIGTGSLRKNFGHYQTVTTAREAILPVFFGEADACVVSMAAYQSVMAQNPSQIRAKLKVLDKSEELPSQVVACKEMLPVDAQRRVLGKAKNISWDFGDQNGGVIPAEEVAFDKLRYLLETRNSPVVPAAAQPVPASSKLQTSHPVKPFKRP